MIRKRWLFSVLAVIPAFIGLPTAVYAQQAIHGDNGAPFMEEVNDDGKATQWHSTNTPAKPVGQAIKADDGSMFMEEVPQKKKPRQAPNPQIDFSNLGVPVDANGKIIPLLRPGGPSVQPNYSSLELDYTPRQVYVPYNTFYGPYSYAPQRTPWGRYGVPLYQPQANGFFTVPSGIPRSFTSSSDLPEASQQAQFQFSGSYINGFPGIGGGLAGFNGGLPGINGLPVTQAPNGSPGGSIWGPAWRSPWGGTAWVPQVTQFQEQGSIKAFFPPNLNQ